MNAPLSVPEATGDYDVRGRDTDTALCGPVMDALIDADRIARGRMALVLPYWELYRFLYALDHLRAVPVREECIRFAVLCVVRGGLLKQCPRREELAKVAALDALYLLRYHDEMQAPSVTAADLGVSTHTYTRFRTLLYRLWRAGVDEYFGELRAAYRHVKNLERAVQIPKTGEILKLEGEYQGLLCANSVTPPAPDPDTL